MFGLLLKCQNVCAPVCSA